MRRFVLGWKKLGLEQSLGTRRSRSSGYATVRPGYFSSSAPASPLLLQFFFRLAFESQLAFANVVSTAIDSGRFAVFGMLRVQEPSSRSEERALWGRIAGNGELLYAPQEASRGGASAK
jgi:hypothetical protein